MFRTEGTPAYLRRKTAGEALALRAGRQTARSDVQLARVQGQQLSQTESHVAEKISGCGVVVETCVVRSEEHTSELQSQSNIVCRLLLEKKKKKRKIRDAYVTCHTCIYIR